MFFPLNKRPTLNRLSFLLLFSVYIAVFLNLAFYHQVIAAMPLDSVRNWLVFLSMPLVAMSVINIVVTLASFIKRLTFFSISAIEIELPSNRLMPAF